MQIQTPKEVVSELRRTSYRQGTLETYAYHAIQDYTLSSMDSKNIRYTHTTNIEDPYGKLSNSIRLKCCCMLCSWLSLIEGA